MFWSTGWNAKNNAAVLSATSLFPKLWSTNALNAN